MKYFWIFLLLIACTTTSEYSSNDQLAQKIAGTYSGIFPCTDCDGIRYRLVLHSDHLFERQLVFMGKSADPRIESGTYSFSDSTLRLDGAESMHIFRIEDGVLTLLDAGENPDQEEQYTLSLMKPRPDEMATAEPPVQGNDPWIRKYNEGVDFFATGTEPFWSLEMDMDKFIRFKGMDGPEITLPPVEGIRAQDANVILFRGESESGALDVTINQSSCTNAMSGVQFPFSVRIRYKSGDMTDYTEVTGCGNYVANPRLHNIWAFISVNGNPLQTADFPNGLPRIELFTAEGRVLGFDGCNTFRGTFYEKDKELYFGALASTEMACMDLPEGAGRIASGLNYGKFGYQFEDGLLVLTRGELRFELRNVD